MEEQNSACVVSLKKEEIQKRAVELHGPTVAEFALGVALLAHECGAEVVVGQGIVWVHLDRAHVGVDGGGSVAFCPQDIGQVDHKTPVGSQLYGLLVVSDSLAESAQRLVVRSNVVVRFRKGWVEVKRPLVALQHLVVAVERAERQGHVVEDSWLKGRVERERRFKVQHGLLWLARVFERVGQIKVCERPAGPAVRVGDGAAFAQRRNGLRKLARPAEDLANGEPGLGTRSIEAASHFEALDRLRTHALLLQMERVRSHALEVVAGLFGAHS